MRALIQVLETDFPDWRTQVIHESSPAGPSSEKLRREGARYQRSFFLPDVPLGSMSEGRRCENLESLTLPSASIDLFITQDVLEHVLNPAAAFSEIARVLRPGGAHVFTVPFWPERATTTRARRGPDGMVRSLEEPLYHDDPVDPRGALVVTDWGRDLPEAIRISSNLATEIRDATDEKLGIVGSFAEVFISRWP